LSDVNLGDYEIDSLELGVVGGHQLVFQPVEINMPGASGRVDLSRRGNNTHKVMLLLVEQGDNNLQWELWKSLGDKRLPFDKEALEALLAQWIES